MKKIKSGIGRALAGLMVVAALLVAVVPPPAGAEQLDESQTTVDTAISFQWGACQSFRPDLPWIYQVRFYLDPGSEVEYLTVRIDNDQDLENGCLGSRAFDVTGWSEGWHIWRPRSYGGDIPVTPGETYYLQIVPLFPPMVDFPTWYGTDRNLYAAGGAYWYDDANTAHAIAGRDFGFEIYGDCNPVADFTYYTDNLTLYVNASNSYAPDGGTIDSYEWDWDGDGTYENTSSDAAFNHTYEVAGDYTVKLRVTDDDGHTDVKSRTVSVTEGGGGYPPHAYFVYHVENYTIYVNASQSYDTDGTISSYMWDWDGDGFYDDTESDPLANHTYPSDGTYNVTLRVQDDQGNTDTYTRTGVQIPAAEEEEDDGGGGGGWFNFKIPFEWFSMFTVMAIGILGMAVSAVFFKPESVKSLGVAPALGAVLITVLAVADILMYHAGFEWYWLVLVAGLCVFILYMVIVTVRKR